MKKMAVITLVLVLCLTLSGCAFVRNIIPAMLDHISIGNKTSTLFVDPNTATPKVTVRPTATPSPRPTVAPTPTPTAISPTAEPELPQPQGIQLPMAP